MMLIWLKMKCILVMLVSPLNVMHRLIVGLVWVKVKMHNLPNLRRAQTDMHQFVFPVTDHVPIGNNAHDSSKKQVGNVCEVSHDCILPMEYVQCDDC